MIVATLTRHPVQRSVHGSNIRHDGGWLTNRLATFAAQTELALVEGSQQTPGQLLISAQLPRRHDAAPLGCSCTNARPLSSCSFTTHIPKSYNIVPSTVFRLFDSALILLQLLAMSTENNVHGADVMTTLGRRACNSRHATTCTSRDDKSQPVRRSSDNAPRSPKARQYGMIRGGLKISATSSHRVPSKNGGTEGVLERSSAKLQPLLGVSKHAPNQSSAASSTPSDAEGSAWGNAGNAAGTARCTGSEGNGPGNASGTARCIAGSDTATGVGMLLPRGNAAGTARCIAGSDIATGVGMLDPSTGSLAVETASTSEGSGLSRGECSPADATRQGSGCRQLPVETLGGDSHPLLCCPRQGNGGNFADAGRGRSGDLLRERLDAVTQVGASSLSAGQNSRKIGHHTSQED